MKDFKDMTPLELDAYKYEHRFDEAEEVMGKEAADALRKLIDFYGKDWIDWLASLYDAETGSFYYSNSARDNEQFKPDCESTCQAHSIIRFMGLLDVYNDDYIKAYPNETRENCLEFIRNLQSDVDGYFYHPQWGTKIGAARKGRDFSQCIELIERFGGTPKYRTAMERLSSEASADNDKSVLPAHLLSKEAMKEYLDKLNINHESHSFGHIVSAQNEQIRAAGLAEFVCEYANARQNPETGLWEEGANYSTLSGVIKVGAVLGGLGSYVHHGDKIVDSAMDVIMSDVNPEYINYVFNPWGAFGAAIGGASRTEKLAKEQGIAVDFSVADIRKKIYARLPELVDKTIEKLKKFQKPDGSFSYEQHRSAPETQGVPVSLGVYEGDVNGLACAMFYPLHSIFPLLGIKKVHMCNHDDFLRLRDKMVEAHKIYENR
ncbi:MAG: hypothetical protein IJW03_02250 [Clostridia bacterium]|nr:hypothetical protein [Clostridia bacterium]